MSKIRSNTLILPAFLVLATFVPTLIAAVRVFEFSLPEGAPLLLEKSHVSIAALAFHGATAAGFLVIGALQILPGLRRRYRTWHKRLGKFALTLGVLGAASGLWIALRYGDISGPVLFYARIGASVFWLLSMAAAASSIQKRNWRAHGTWMLRAYAMALPAGTLPFILLPFIAVFGAGHTLAEEWIQALAWPVHLLVIEWLRRRPTRMTATA